MKRDVLVMVLVSAIAALLGANAVLAAAGTGLTRTHSGGGVTVKVTYLESESKDDVRFQVVLDTHSISLDAIDLKKLSLLRDDLGKAYEPTGVENKGSGHHREIAVVFPHPSAGAKRLDLVIQDVAQIKERIFSWDLK